MYPTHPIHLSCVQHTQPVSNTPDPTAAQAEAVLVNTVTKKLLLRVRTRSEVNHLNHHASNSEAFVQ